MELLGGPPKRKSRGLLYFFLFVVVAPGIAVAGMAGFRAGDPPQIEIKSDLPAIGKRTEISVNVRAGRRGLSTVKVEFVQGDRVEVLASESFAPQPPHNPFAPSTPATSIHAAVGRESIEGLKQGEASIRVTAGIAPALISQPAPVVKELVLPVRIVPPSVQVTSQFIYVAQGGCEVVVYDVGESAVKHGVQAGDWWFPGYKLPGGGPREHFAFFAAPYTDGDDSKIRLVAEDDVRNEISVPFVHQFTPRPFKTDTINVTDRFMSIVVPNIMAATPGLADKGSLVDNYVEINRDLRKANSQSLVELAASSEPKFFWSKPFVQMPAKVFSAFADRRTYMYEGKEIDREDHLGFDLASTQKADIPAANSGKVVLAEYFGIFGNAVVIDHGYGLMSLYGHMSSMAVQKGQMVERGQSLGRTGATGLALGDHLHFTMLLHGLPVTPVEWWDGHWIRDRIARKLGKAFDFSEG